MPVSVIAVSTGELFSVASGRPFTNFSQAFSSSRPILMYRSAVRLSTFLGSSCSGIVLVSLRQTDAAYTSEAMEDKLPRGIYGICDDSLRPELPLAEKAKA